MSIVFGVQKVVVPLAFIHECLAMVSQASRCGSRENPCDDSFFSLSEMHQPTTCHKRVPFQPTAFFSWMCRRPKMLPKATVLKMNRRI